MTISRGVRSTRPASSIFPPRPRDFPPLARLLAFAPYPEAALPHSRGYCRLLSGLLEHLWDHPAEYPGLDRSLNLCRQLHKLSREDLRKAARVLARRAGIVE